MTGKMTKERWTQVADKLKDPLKEFERIVRQQGLGLVSMSAFDCTTGIRAETILCEDGTWYHVRLVDRHVELSVNNEKPYCVIS